MPKLRSVAASAAVLLLPGLASAQAIQVDFSGSVPSASFGAASGQVGVWQPLTCGDCYGATMPLVGITGQSTAVTMSFSVNLGDPYACAASGHSPDEAALLEDGRRLLTLGSLDAHVLGLNPGMYDVFLYATARCDFGPNLLVSRVTTRPVSGGAPTSIQEQTIAFGLGTPGFVYRANYGRIRVSVAAGDSLDILGCCTEASLNGLQIVPITGSIVPVCFGTNEWMVGRCCAQAGEFGRGCPWSADARGAMLTGSGTASVGADALVLQAADMSGSFVTFFQGTLLFQPAFESALGDGLGCAGGALTRLSTKLASGGMVSYPSVGEAPVSVQGLVPPAGGTRAYQVLYRDAVSFCSSATFNTTNAVIVSWSP
jgi:hypothetical protein